MNALLFQIDPMAASSYGLYQGAKENKGSFVDFLLSYDSKSANDGDNSWLNKIVGQDIMDKITSPEMVKVLSYANIDTSDFFSTQNYFDTKVNMYKMQLEQEIAKRDASSSEIAQEDIPNLEDITKHSQEQLKKLALNQYSLFSTFF